MTYLRQLRSYHRHREIRLALGIVLWVLAFFLAVADLILYLKAYP